MFLMGSDQQPRPLQTKSRGCLPRNYPELYKGMSRSGSREMLAIVATDMVRDPGTGFSWRILYGGTVGQSSKGPVFYTI